MQLEYEIEINAPPRAVCDTLVLRQTYGVWAKACSRNSYYDGDWVQGSEVMFLDPDMGGTKAVLEDVEPEK